MKIDLIVKTDGQLVTCASQGAPKTGTAMRNVGLGLGAAVAINDGNIIAVGPSAEIVSQYECDELIDAEHRAVCPGFVDPHTHIVFGGDRLDEFELKLGGADYLEILRSGGGILSTVARTREASADELVAGGLDRLDKMLRCGTTTAEIKTGYGLELESELKMLDAIECLDRRHPITIVPTFLPAHAVPPEYRDNGDAYVEDICRNMLPAAWSWYERSGFYGSRPFFIDIFTEANAFDLNQMKLLLSEAEKFGFKTKAHVDEFSNLGGSGLAIELGAVSIDHLDRISDEEVNLLANSRTTAIVTPTVNFNFGSSHFADARRLVDSGCAVALSTDFNPGSAPCPSQQASMAIACRYQKLFPAEALNAATVNAAFGCGMGASKGSIEVGKDADLLILETTDYRNLAYEFGGNSVNSVIKAGEVVFRAP